MKVGDLTLTLQKDGAARVLAVTLDGHPHGLHAPVRRGPSRAVHRR